MHYENGWQEEGGWRNRIVETRWIKAGELVDNAGNPRTHPAFQRAALEGLLDEVGIVQGLLAYHSEREGGALVLLDGHLRKEVDPSAVWPVHVTDLTDEEADLVLAAFDPIGALAITDARRYEELAGRVRPQSDALLALLATVEREDTGLYEEEEGGPEPRLGGDEFLADGLPEVERRTEEGELWRLGEHRLLVGDATDEEAVRRLLGGERVVLMVTDPPYGVDYDPQWRNEHPARMKDAVGMLGRVGGDDRADWSVVYGLFDPQVLYVWHAGKYSGAVYAGVEAQGYEVVSQIIWVKDHFAIGRGDYHWGHEPCVYAVRQGSTHNWQGARDQSTVWHARRLSSNPAFSQEEVWGHGTQKPMMCMERPVLNSSAPRELVVDPFLGTGTTLIAAHRARRICYGMEVDPLYADIVLARWEAESGREAIREG